MKRKIELWLYRNYYLPLTIKKAKNLGLSLYVRYNDYDIYVDEQRRPYIIHH